MLKINSVEAKTKEDGLEKILKELECSEEDLHLDADKVEGKLFKSDKYIVRAIKKDDVKDELRETIKTIGDLFNITIDSEILCRDRTYTVNLITDKTGILIGKNGKTLNAIQILLRQKIKNQVGLGIKVNIDIANYKLNKMKTLEREMKKIAREILETQVNVELDPMNSYERRLVHNLINDYDKLSTESIGEGKDRHIVIKYIEEV